MIGEETPIPSNNILHMDEKGPARKQPLNYRFVIGMLNFLSSSKRPDILFIVQQCTIFCTSPRLIREQAVKRVIRYLSRTENKGIEVNIGKPNGMEYNVDADFCGNYHKDNSEDPTNLLSRTGFVILYTNYPIVWVSMLQGCISLSTTESEYIILSHVMRVLIMFTGLVEELIATVVGLPPSKFELLRGIVL